jgi:hypothetical protein
MRKTADAYEKDAMRLQENKAAWLIVSGDLILCFV